MKNDDVKGAFEYANPFSEYMNEKILIKHMFELVVKSSAMLTQVGQLCMPREDLNILEMSLNKGDAMMEKSKLCIFRIGMLYIVLPFKLTKIEVRTRNVIINTRPRFEAISKFIGIYLKAFEEQDEKDNDERLAWEEE